MEDDPRSKFADAAAELYEARFPTPEKKAAEIARLRQARLAAIAKRRGQGLSVDPLTPSQRIELGRKGGRASAAKRIARFGEAEQKQLRDARTVAVLKHQAFTPAPGANTERLSRGHLIKLPRSSPRGNAKTYCRLLLAINPAAIGSFAFEGSWLKPGVDVEDCALRPTAEYPPVPIILEFAGPCGKNEFGEKESVYILWELKKRVWTEIARARSSTSQWSTDLAPIAARVLGGFGYPKAKKPIALGALADRISKFIDHEMLGLDAESAADIAGVVFDELGCRLAAGAKGITARFEVITEAIEEKT